MKASNVFEATLKCEPWTFAMSNESQYSMWSYTHQSWNLDSTGPRQRDHLALYSLPPVSVANASHWQMKTLYLNYSLVSIPHKIAWSTNASHCRLWLWNRLPGWASLRQVNFVLLEFCSEALTSLEFPVQGRLALPQSLSLCLPCSWFMKLLDFAVSSLSLGFLICTFRKHRMHL